MFDYIPLIEWDKGKKRREQHPAGAWSGVCTFPEGENRDAQTALRKKKGGVPARWGNVCAVRGVWLAGGA